LGFGCGAVGGLMVKGDAVEQRRAVEQAIDAGIRYFDTAPSYGDGRSETNLGRVLHELGSRASHLVVGTKFHVDPANPANVPAAIRASLETSLRRLQMERVHLLQLHSRIARSGPRSVTPQQVLGPILDGLRAVRDAGLAQHVGITANGDTDAIRQVLESGQVESAQIFFNALNPSAGYAGHTPPGGHDFGGIVDVAAQHTVGVIVIRSLAAGAVSARDERHANAGDPGGITGERYEEDLARARALAALAAELGLESPVELALRFAIAKPGVSTVIVGYSDVGQLTDAIRWAERGALPPAAVDHVLALTPV
jgi:L-galactose dehydrogenase/L-glyceraldehyde 3-phosphate reductase